MSLADRIVPHRIGQRLLAANLMLATGIIAIFAVLLVAVLSLRQASERAEHSARVVAAAAGLEKSVLDLETGLRGYALTGRLRFLQPYLTADGRVDAESAGLMRLVRGVPRQERLARDVDARIREYRSVYGTQFLAAVRRDGVSAGSRIARTGAGKRRVDAMRVRFDAIVANENALAASRQATVGSRRTLALVALALGTVLVLLFVALKQLALRRWVLDPVQHVRDAAGRMEAGDLSARTGLKRDDEIGEVGIAFDRMAGVLQEREGELQRSNAELEEFAYVASHDLAEPLRAMGGYADLLGRRYADVLDDRGQRYVRGITAAAERMRGLIDDLLAYSRVGRRDLELRDVDVARLLDTVRDDLSVAIRESGAEIHANGLPTVTADANQLRMVLQNLVANAIKFRAEAPPRIDVTGAADDEFWRISVADNGIGIEPRHADRIFRMFQRLHTREEYEGTGIGLALVERVLERHGGEIAVSPREGGGSIFTFTLPRMPPQ